MNASFGVGSYYSNNGSTLDNANLYWLNNFNTLGRSFGKFMCNNQHCILYKFYYTVTLYEEMVVNNWFIQMVQYN